MKKIIFSLLLASIFSPPNALASESSFTKLICAPSKEEATISVIFSRPTFASRPFMYFANFSATVTLDHQKLATTYIRRNVIFIPETLPPGVDMRGQSSDSLYIQLHPEFIDGQFSGTYFGQLFINDKDREFRGTYFRYMNSEMGPGIICHPEI